MILIMELEERVKRISERIKEQKLKKYDKIELVIKEGIQTRRVVGYIFDLPGRCFLTGEEFEGPTIRYSLTLNTPEIEGRKLNQRKTFGQIECYPLAFLDDIIKL